jgi:hypothetical protein
MKPAAFGLAALLCALPALAQQPTKLPLAFTANTPDDIGARMASAVRDKLRRSSTVALMPDREAAWLWVHLMSIRMEGTSATSYALVAGLNDDRAWSGASYWSAQVGNCGSDATERCAVTVLAFIDQAVSEFQAENARRQAKQSDKRP